MTHNPHIQALLDKLKCEDRQAVLKKMECYLREQDQKTSLQKMLAFLDEDDHPQEKFTRKRG